MGAVSPVGGEARLAFYATPSATTDLARYSADVRALPSDPDELGKIVRGLLLHNFMATVRGLRFPPERRNHMQTIGAEAVLEHVLELDPKPLEQRRSAEHRMVGFCYHFALLHCAFLRAKGVPARIRCGFAGYFEPGQWIDHWVVEHWDGRSWRLNDPQTGRSDLTDDDFHDGLRAWQLCRKGELAPAAHGNGELWGWDELRGSLVNDLGALNKVEVSGWYWCDRIQVTPISEPHPSLDGELDEIARKAVSADSVDVLRAIFDGEPGLRPLSDAVAR